LFLGCRKNSVSVTVSKWQPTSCIWPINQL